MKKLKVENVNQKEINRKNKENKLIKNEINPNVNQKEINRNEETKVKKVKKDEKMKR